MSGDTLRLPEEVIGRAIVAGEAVRAVALIEKVLPELVGEELGRAHQLRALAREDLSEWELVAQDYELAARLFRDGSYAQYVCALGAGATRQRLGHVASARDWYRSALRAAAGAVEPFSGGEAAKSLLMLQEVLSPGDVRLVEEVLAGSWRLLELPGEPDLGDPLATAQTLVSRGATWAG